MEDIQYLIIFYDGSCNFCVSCKKWLQRQSNQIVLRFVDIQTITPTSEFHYLLNESLEDNLTVLDSEGRLFFGDDAFLMTLYGLWDYRKWSFRLAQPSTKPLTKMFFSFVSKYRKQPTISALFFAQEEFERGQEKKGLEPVISCDSMQKCSLPKPTNSVTE